MLGTHITSISTLMAFVSVLFAASSGYSTFSSGSDGRDGVLNPTEDIVIDMADHPDGIYQYVSVNIPNDVTVSFKPNAANTPVVWLIQGDCVIAFKGVVNLSGSGGYVSGGVGGPGGFRGGNAVLGSGLLAECGQGPGGGQVGTSPSFGGNASFGTLGSATSGEPPPGDLYGNEYNLPLLGGSGGAGGFNSSSGGGGGGAILIVANHISINGTYTYGNGNIIATGGDSYLGGGGSGGAIRLVAGTLDGAGWLNTNGGSVGYPRYASGGSGRIRLEAFSDSFVGGCSGVSTRGMQSIIFLPSGTAPSLTITQVSGISVPPNPSGASLSPDVLLPGELTNPMSIVVHAANLPINTPITVEVKPYSGIVVSATAQNVGTLGASTATVSLNIPRGGGTITAKAVTAVNPTKSSEDQTETLSYRDTGFTTAGERFKTAEVSATLGGESQLVYVTESGKRFPVKVQ